MFKAKKQSLNPDTMDTLIGEGTIFEGKITSAAGVRIEGQLTGDILSEGDVTIGEKATVKSSISSRDITIAGIVHGNIKAKGKITITSKGELYGNISAPSFIIEEGGIFEGNSMMKEQNGKAENQTESNVKPIQEKSSGSPAASASMGGNPFAL
ncbi:MULTISPECIES: bactofilin family protein [Paenibacillus]|uniref:Polymer-forming cytoskeletal protein n=1 Tax=Paenibacillus naphthalenovorans TaxID=162209 RepID=A0A0U2WG32_9BACL|nr:MULTISPECIES: polymer-forming cytoskeletal protein [Paenibacillus]ALS25342.1 polymer-forming cytoskeletal protein [Paenibacillus naphthalenovorans]NTZ20247.1 polymer-forming cytoskeletal protein [Paenibacillus sp. JMULE4]GCL74769.1 polymer-forming cytoskeletal protein [Paenibacillus naphthalenovorans]SDJ63520.1 protein CcmA, bactofilin family [Paenibacillus naphthalenovorans]